MQVNEGRSCSTNFDTTASVKLPLNYTGQKMALINYTKYNKKEQISIKKNK